MSSLGGSVRRRAIGRVTIVAGVVSVAGTRSRPSVRRPTRRRSRRRPSPGRSPARCPATGGARLSRTRTRSSPPGRPRRERLRRGGVLPVGRRRRLRDHGQPASPTDVPYRTRIVVRRPAARPQFNGTVLRRVAERHRRLRPRRAVERRAHDARRVRLGRRLRPARRRRPARAAGARPATASLDVTGGGAFTADQLSYDIFAQAAKAVARAGRRRPARAASRRRTVLAIGASQSAGRMTDLLRRRPAQVEPVFDGYALHRRHAPRPGSGPSRSSRCCPRPTCARRSPAPDTDLFRRWEVAGAAHSGWQGQEYRAPISDPRPRRGTRLPAAPSRRSAASRCSHVTAAAYDHLVRWVGGRHAAADRAAAGVQRRRHQGPQRARPGAGRHPAVAGDGADRAEHRRQLRRQSFCVLFGTHQPFDEATLDELYRSHGRYVAAVHTADRGNVRAGYIVTADAAANHQAAVHSEIGK